MIIYLGWFRIDFCIREGILKCFYFSLGVFIILSVFYDLGIVFIYLKLNLIKFYFLLRVVCVNLVVFLEISV